MSNSIVGNNANPTECFTWYEVEVDDDEYEDMEGEMVDEQNIFARRAVIPKNSNSTTVTIFYYYLAPTSSWFWDYNYGVNYTPVVPVVFAADSEWKLIQCLNASFNEISLTGQSNGWKSFNVTLTRKLVEGERIVFGLYSDIFGYTSTGEIEDSETTMSYFYWTRAHRRDYANQISYVSSQDFISQQRNIFNDYEICEYLQYENEPDGLAYSYTVLGNVGAVARFSNRSLTAVRKPTGLCALECSNRRIAFFKFSKNESLGFLDSVQKLLLLIRSCISGFGSNDSTSRTADYKKEIESTSGNSESLTRFGENKRSFEDEAEIVARPFASRIFFRTVETVMSFWDWLRGKIREANYVVNFFTPVVLEVTLDGKNMNRIYKGQTKIRVLLDCQCDISGYANVKIKARKPDGITDVIFPAVVKDAEKGIIFYDVQSENDFDIVGWWTLWPMFVFDDDRTNCGRAQRAFVYEEGT